MMQKKRSNSWRKFTILGALPLVVFLMSMTGKTPLKATIEKQVEPLNNVLTGENDPGKPTLSPLNEKDIIKISSYFGNSSNTFNIQQMHTGVDLRAKEGTPIYATADGQVVFAKNSESHGNYVQIKHSDKYSTQYSHMSRFIVSPNAQVKKGDIIGYVGESGKANGPHLHYEVHVDGKAVNPVEYFDAC